MRSVPFEKFFITALAWTCSCSCGWRSMLVPTEEQPHLHVWASAAAKAFKQYEYCTSMIVYEYEMIVSLDLLLSCLLSFQLSLVDTGAMLVVV